MNESKERPHRPVRKALVKIAGFAVALLLAVMIAMSLLCPMIVSRPAPRQTQCLNNVRNIGLALLNYALTNPATQFPAACLADRTGGIRHSWRVAIAGFLDQPAFARKYRWDESWNSSRNARLGQDLKIWGLHCPDDPDNPSNTSYVVVVGPHTLFPGTQPRGLNEIKRPGGAAETILVIELPRSGVHWMEPRDLKYEDAIRGLGISGEPIAGVHPSSGRHATINVCFADGHAQPIPLEGFGEFVRDHAWIDRPPDPISPDSSR